MTTTAQTTRAVMVAAHEAAVAHALTRAYRAVALAENLQHTSVPVTVEAFSPEVVADMCRTFDDKGVSCRVDARVCSLMLTWPAPTQEEINAYE